MISEVNRGKEYFIKCECGTEGLHIDKDEYDGFVYFSLWHFDLSELTWLNKLRWIWYVIKGKPYHDTVVVAPERIQGIIDILESMKSR